MGLITLEDVLKATGGEILSKGADIFTGVCIDSRKIKHGELFVPLKGSKNDGHESLLDAIKTGNGAFVSIKPDRQITDKTIIFVEDALKALQDLAYFLRLKRNVPVIAITGTNGKTTTKELTAEILGTEYKVLKNEGNFNNHIGLPLSLTNLTQEDGAIVLEMGASGRGDIKQLCEIALPDYGVLTNIGYAHISGFGNIETIRSTKLEMLEFVKTVAVNFDDKFMVEGISSSKFSGELIYYSAKEISDVYAKDIKLHEKGLNFEMHIKGEESIRIESSISGIFNVYNILAASSIAYKIGISLKNIQKAVNYFTGVPMRLEYSYIDGVTFIKDMYNANPNSVQGALEELSRTKKKRAIAVLGDMLELGSYAEEAHRNIGRILSKLNIDIFIAVGTLMKIASDEFKGTVYTSDTASEAGKILSKILKEGDSVLIKGSRGMGMEKVMEELCCTV